MMVRVSLKFKQKIISYSVRSIPTMPNCDLLVLAVGKFVS